MPIYEFYCKDCHTIFNFFSHRVNTEARPLCPRCRRVTLQREPSRFATLKRKGAEDPTPFDDLDETKVEGAMESVVREMEGIGDQPNPRQLAKIMRRLGEASGVELGPRMEEMIGRLEAGEDPESLEDQMGDLEGESGAGDEGLEEFFKLKKRASRSARKKPQADETLYFL